MSLLVRLALNKKVFRLLQAETRSKCIHVAYRLEWTLRFVSMPCRNC
jgi:hypothetical protein